MKSTRCSSEVSQKLALGWKYHHCRNPRLEQSGIAPRRASLFQLGNLCSAPLDALIVLLETSLEVALLDQFKSIRVAGQRDHASPSSEMNEYITCPHDSNRTAPVFALPILATAWTGGQPARPSAARPAAEPNRNARRLRSRDRGPGRAPSPIAPASAIPRSMIMISGVSLVPFIEPRVVVVFVVRSNLSSLVFDNAIAPLLLKYFSSLFRAALLQ